MAPKLNPRAPAETELVQTRVNKQAKKLLTEMADTATISEAAIVRQLLYKALGLMKEN